MHGIDWNDPDQSAADAEWRVPAAEMKQELFLRDADNFDHVVPLPPQAVEVLRVVRTLTGRSKQIFLSARDANEPMSENAVNYLYHRLGHKGVHVAHGWRSSFSTIMNERSERQDHGDDRLTIDRLIIDLMLAHRPLGMSESHSSWMAEMRSRAAFACHVRREDDLLRNVQIRVNR